jgi:hypothetical protein
MTVYVTNACRISWGPIHVFLRPIRLQRRPEWSKIVLDELYSVDYLFSAQDPLTLKYCQKFSNSPKNLSRFVHKGDQTRSRVDLDKTQRALSNGLLIFVSRLFLHGEKLEILPKRSKSA